LLTVSAEYIDGLGPKIKPHTDLAEVKVAMKMILDAGVAPWKINMGTAAYGRGFTVKDKNCMYYGCKFTGSSKSGQCTKEDGLLSLCEINRMIRDNRLQPKLVYGGAKVKEITFNDQYISYDDEETLGYKYDLAYKLCIGGTALWALDYNHCDS
jgi:GH18 family chitinase